MGSTLRPIPYRDDAPQPGERERWQKLRLLRWLLTRLLPTILVVGGMLYATLANWRKETCMEAIKSGKQEVILAVCR